MASPRSRRRGGELKRGGFFFEQGGCFEVGGRGHVRRTGGVRRRELGPQRLNQTMRRGGLESGSPLN